MWKCPFAHLIFLLSCCVIPKSRKMMNSQLQLFDIWWASNASLIQLIQKLNGKIHLIYILWATFLLHCFHFFKVLLHFFPSLPILLWQHFPCESSGRKKHILMCILHRISFRKLIKCFLLKKIKKKKSCKRKKIWFEMHFAWNHEH